MAQYVHLSSSGPIIMISLGIPQGTGSGTSVDAKIQGCSSPSWRLRDLSTSLPPAPSPVPIGARSSRSLTIYYNNNNLALLSAHCVLRDLTGIVSFGLRAIPTLQLRRRDQGTRSLPLPPSCSTTIRRVVSYAQQEGMINDHCSWRR